MAAHTDHSKNGSGLMLKPILLTLLLLGGMPAWAEDCGFDAYANDEYAAALKPLTECAKQGNAGAQYGLGWMYSNGEGVPQDDVKADKRALDILPTEQRLSNTITDRNVL